MFGYTEKQIHQRIHQDMKKKVDMYRTHMSENLGRYDFNDRYIYSMVELLESFNIPIYSLEGDLGREFKDIRSALVIENGVPKMFIRPEVRPETSRFDVYYLLVMYHHRLQQEDMVLFDIGVYGFDFKKDKEVYHWTLDLFVPKKKFRYERESFFLVPEIHFEYEKPFFSSIF